MTCRDASLRYADHGWAVLPLQPRGKLPLTEHGSRDASADTGQLEEWWRRWPSANVGIAAGLVSGLVVVDLDGEEGVSSWRRLVERHGPAETLVGRTGSGGYHLLYGTSERLRNSAKLVGPGIDTRGEGGYIVGPPSVHPNGTPYAWVRERPVIDVPAWLVARLRAREIRDAPPHPAVMRPIGMTPYGRAALERILRELLAATEGARNDSLFRASLSAGRLTASAHLSRSDCEEALVGASRHIGLALTEAAKTFESGFAVGMKYPTSVTAAELATSAA